MTFEEVMQARRSVRSYEEKPVEMNVIKSLIAESTLAPSAGNSQPWKFIIINNKEIMAQVSAESKQNLLNRIASNPEDPAKTYEQMLKKEDFNVFYNAPALVLIVGDEKIKNLVSDCSLAACYLMMAAAEKGLGTCWVNLGGYIKSTELINKLGIPDGHTIVAPIILGYPAKIPSAPKRNVPQILKEIE